MADDAAPARSRPRVRAAPCRHVLGRDRHRPRATPIRANSAAATFDVPRRVTTSPARRATVPRRCPMARMQHSASVTARPPSEQSCADRIEPLVRAASPARACRAALARPDPAPAARRAPDRASPSDTRCRPARRAVSPSSMMRVARFLKSPAARPDPRARAGRRRRWSASDRWPCRRSRCRG